MVRLVLPSQTFMWKFLLVNVTQKRFYADFTIFAPTPFFVDIINQLLVNLKLFTSIPLASLSNCS